MPKLLFIIQNKVNTPPLYVHDLKVFGRSFLIMNNLKRLWEITK